MFSAKRPSTVIAEGFKIVGSVEAEGVVEINGRIDGEMRCTAITVSRNAHVAGSIVAEQIVINGTVEGPIHGGDVVLKSQAHVTGDISCQSIVVEKGAFMEGRLERVVPTNGAQSQAAGATNGASAVEPRRADKATAGETSTRKAELVVEARHISGNPNLSADEALGFLAKRGNDQAKALIEKEKAERPAVRQAWPKKG
jgi:cytoskeletal protein CcmA (bactofilin family)